MHLRSTRNLKNEISLQEPIGVDKEGNEVSLLDLLSRSDEEISEALEVKEESQELYNIIRVLDEKEKYVIRFRYGLGELNRKTQREIAKDMQISRSYVSRPCYYPIKEVRSTGSCLFYWVMHKY